DGGRLARGNFHIGTISSIHHGVGVPIVDRRGVEIVAEQRLERTRPTRYDPIGRTALDEIDWVVKGIEVQEGFTPLQVDSAARIVRDHVAQYSGIGAGWQEPHTAVAVVADLVVGDEIVTRVDNNPRSILLNDVIDNGTVCCTHPDSGPGVVVDKVVQE